MHKQAEGTSRLDFLTMKAAREAGLRTAGEWLREELLQDGERRRPMIPKRNGKPVVVKGKLFFSLDQCEDVISATEAKKRGLRVPEGVESVKNGRGRYGHYPMFRVSDCIPESQASGVKTQEDYLALSDLKTRGWTGAMVRRLLPTPDKQTVNPHFKSGAPMQLFSRFRIESIEKSEEFQEAMTLSAPRKLAAQAAAATKRSKTAARIEAIPITIPRYERDKLIQLACDSYNVRNEHREKDRATLESDPEFLARICVNLLRHEGTQYDSVLASIHGDTGKADAHTRLKERVLDAIAEAYPWLEEECDRQFFEHLDEESDRMFFK